ncbi:MAG: hypothetical protein H6706_23365 [Myxococcales bacterium]|nr:hypothetical protein [Myxococcales bacterium]
MIRALTAALLLAGCSLDPFLCAPCEGACPGELTCEAGQCTSPVAVCAAPLAVAEAGAPDAAPDAAVDAASPAAADAGPDAAPRPDAGPADAGADASPPLPGPCNPTWTRLWPPNGPIEQDFPGVRTGAAGVWAETPGGAGLLLHGGVVNNAAQGDTWLYQPGLQRWTRIQTDVGPGPRSFHRLFATPDGVVLLGGPCLDVDGAPLWRLTFQGPDTATWTPLDPVATLPARWCRFDAAVDGDQVWVYGGGSNGQIIEPPPLFRIRLSDGRALAIRRPVPDPTSHLSAAVAYAPDAGGLYVVGGGLPPTWDPIRRFWQFDDDAWRELPSGTLPIVTDARAAWLPAVRRVVVFGGAIPDYHVTDALLVYEPTLRRWSTFSSALQGRQSPGLVALPEGDAVIIHGGYGGIEESYVERDDIWRVRLSCPP